MCQSWATIFPPAAWTASVVSFQPSTWLSFQSPGAFGQPSWPGWVHSVPGDSSFPYLLVVGVAAGCIFAAVSWYLLELPLQRFKGGPRRPARFPLL